jgi:hypothetical protein
MLSSTKKSRIRRAFIILAEMTRHIPVGRIVAVVVGSFVLYILFQAYSQHWHVGAVLPAVISLFLFLLYLIQKLIGALLRILAWPLGFPILVVICCSPLYSGVNVRPLAGFIRDAGLVEKMGRQIRRQQETLRAVATAGRSIDDAYKRGTPYDGDSKISP